MNNKLKRKVQKAFLRGELDDGVIQAYGLEFDDIDDLTYWINGIFDSMLVKTDIAFLIGVYDRLAVPRHFSFAEFLKDLDIEIIIR